MQNGESSRTKYIPSGLIPEVFPDVSVLPAQSTLVGLNNSPHQLKLPCSPGMKIYNFALLLSFPRAILLGYCAVLLKICAAAQLQTREIKNASFVCGGNSLRTGYISASQNLFPVYPIFTLRQDFQETHLGCEIE